MTENECTTEGLDNREAQLVLDFTIDKEVGDKTDRATADDDNSSE